MANFIRQKEPLKTFRDFITEYMKGVYTSIPAHILSFDPQTQLAQIELGIKRVDVDGNDHVLPPIIDCPVMFSGGDEFVIEHQIDVGCEGWALFSQRCIDGWIQTGGTAINPITRFFDMQDACFIPGFRSNPKAVKGFANNGVKLRNKAGNHFVWLKNDGAIELNNSSGHIKIEPSGTVIINGMVFNTNQTITSVNEATVGGITLTTHTHSGVASGNSSTGGPK